MLRKSLIAAALLAASTGAMAGTGVYGSVVIADPNFSIDISNGYHYRGSYYAPGPYWGPPPVGYYYQPAPVYKYKHRYNHHHHPRWNYRGHPPPMKYYGGGRPPHPDHGPGPGGRPW